MADATEAPKRGKAFWAGWVLSALPSVVMLLAGGSKIAHAPPVLENWGKFGYPVSTLTPIGVTEVVVPLLFLFPRTAVLGALLLTAYFGGAVATHVRILDPGGAGPVLFAVVAWAGLWLREPRLRALVPLRS